MSENASSKVSEPKSQKGIVAFLDILGYANFLQNNEPDNAAFKVLSTLNTVPDSVAEILKSYLNRERNRGRVFKVVDEMKWLIFSDTIVLALPYNTDKDDEMSFKWAVAGVSLIILYKHFFDYGLPLRGCVSFGDFLVLKNCFAGRPLIKAYQESNLMDISIIVFDECAVEEAKRLANSKFKGTLSSLQVDYLVPLKNGTGKKYKVLPPGFTQNPYQGDIRQIVTECFIKHGKDLVPGSISKLNHTELFLRYMKSRRSGLFIENKE